MFNPIEASQNIKDEFTSYISTSFHIADVEYAKQFSDKLSEKNMVAKGPYLDISDSFETGKSITTLIEEGVMSQLFSELEKEVPESQKEIKLQRKLYMHQEKSIQKINANKNLVIATGTGSGKTECFVLPIINHLLHEKEAGYLDNGVRAILIYPMNALANDQMKRLRLILKNYPDITFGVYNSSTQQEDTAGIEEYGRIFKDENGRALKPLKNEIISRKTMQSQPPHILVTNYAMLEYMMLRPNDDKVFSGAKLKFLVLDEAHIYRGATGIETSLLLRRLKARISNPSEVRHILTSATLGDEEANCDIVKFASTLCYADFDTDDIIRSQTVMPEFPESSKEYPIELFGDLARPTEPLNKILKKSGIEMPDGKNDLEVLFDLCFSSKIYRWLREYATKPMTVHELTVLMNEKINISEQDVTDLIAVASKAENNKTALIKARYHMFIRALEGVYITLNRNKQLMLKRNNYSEINDEIWKVFEAVVCDDCGRIGIAGKVVNGRLEFTNSRDKEMEVYLIREKNDAWDIENDDEDLDEIVSSDEILKNDFLICAKCGMILHESLKIDFNCGHGANNLIKIRKAERKGIRNDNKCPSCNFGRMKFFYIGYDAATAVLGTELFEQLPENETILQSKTDGVDNALNPFARAAKSISKVDIIKKKRQFITFSDSRSEAAFYACYMTSFYKEFLRRRGIWHVIEKNRASISANPWEVSTLVNELTSYFDTNRTFAEPGDKGTENLTSTSRRQSWIAVLNEMVNARRSTSLVSLGILDFQYKGNSQQMMQDVADKYNQTVEDMTALFNLLVMDIVYNGALEGEDCNLTGDEREYIYYATRPRRFTKCKANIEKEKKKNYLSGWIPRVRDNGISFKNGRVARIVQNMDMSEGDAKTLLSFYWDSVLVGGEYAMTPNGDAEYYISTKQFLIKSGTDELPLYVCDKCRKTTMTNTHNHCVSLKCNGNLKKISHDSVLRDNHFAKLYSERIMQPLHIKEHTAQLGRAEQQAYQEMFVKKEINALSCSTTFEMGVDVGDLETVYLRNMPPSPANYVQRAGRAGRSLHSAAYTLTYAKLGSHDFTYFDKPERMISGKIGVPLFSISNEKVVLRHIFAVVMSDFFTKHEEVYNNNDANVLLNGNGFDLLTEYLKDEPAELKEILAKSIPSELHERMGILDYSWKEKFIGINGVLRNAVEDFRSTVAWYQSEVKKLKKKDDLQAAARIERQLREFRRSSEDHCGRNELIEFLVRNNILPKYGFPVDTVELYQGMISSQEKKLQMVRDLQIAIAEYAPGAQVVADGKLYTSRYIRKLPQATGQDWEEVFIAQCGNKSCMTWNHRIMAPSAEGEKCVSCQKIIEKARWKKAIEPRKGFIAEAKPKEVPLRKPDRSYKSDDYYIGDTQRQVMIKRTFKINNLNKVQMETSANDSLMVVCDDEFFVCDRCGYASSSTARKEDDEDFNSFDKSCTKQHYSPWGKDCTGKLYKKELCHSFKTDVVKIVFGTPRAKNQATMLSVMYALLEAISSVLDIERTDIKGCLHKVRYGKSMISEIILYDAVAGGAGHVRRLVKDNCDVFQKVVQKAISITKGCNCNPSCYNCLRNYYNQAVHDALDRVAVYRFLEEFCGDAVSIPDEEFEEKQIIKPNKVSAESLSVDDGYSCSDYQNWNDFSTMIPTEYTDVFEDFDQYRIPIPNEAYFKCIIPEIDFAPTGLFIWKDKKIIVFDDDSGKIDIDGWRTLLVSEIRARKFSELF